MAPLTFLGLGNMGSALTIQLAKGNVVTAWNRTADRPTVKAAVAAGAKYEPDLHKAVAASDTTIICLLNDSVLTAVLTSLSQDAFSGKTVINFTNGTPKDAAKFAALVRAKGAVRYFDGAIMVPPFVIGTPGSAFVVSGESEDAYSAVSGLLSVVGKETYLGDDVGAASRFENALLAHMYGMFIGAYVGLGFFKRGTKDGNASSAAQALVPLVQALVPLIGTIATAWDKESYYEEDGFPMDMLVETVESVKRTADESGVDFSTMQLFLDRMKKAQANYGPTSRLAAIGPMHLQE